MSGAPAGVSPRALWLLGLGVAALTMLGVPAHATYGARVSADEPQYLLTAMSLGEDLDLDISDEIEAEAYRPFHAVDLDPQTVALDGSGRHVSPHDPLLPVLLAVPMRLGGWVAAKATLAVLAGCLAALTAWTASRRFGVRPRVAVGVVAAFSACAPLATYATQVYPELPAALAVIAAVAAVTGRWRLRAEAAFVVAITALPWLSIKYAPVAAALVVAALWRLRGNRPAALRLSAVLAVLGAVYLLAHRVLYGGWTAYATGDYFAEHGEMAVVGRHPDYLGRSRRLVGLLVDDGFGLAAWAPAWLLLPVAAGFVAARGPHVHRWVLVAPLAAGWLVATFLALTMHGWWWPGRQLVVVLPLAVVCIALLVDASEFARRALLVAAPVGTATWLWTTIEAILRRRVLIVDFDGTANPWIRLWRVALPHGRTPTAADLVLSLCWSALVVAAVVGGWRLGAGSGTGRASAKPGPDVRKPGRPRAIKGA